MAGADACAHGKRERGKRKSMDTSTLTSCMLCLCCCCLVLVAFGWLVGWLFFFFPLFWVNEQRKHMLEALERKTLCCVARYFSDCGSETRSFPAISRALSPDADW